MSSDLLELSRLLKAGLLSRDEIPSYLEMVRGGNSSEPLTLSSPPPTSSSWSSAHIPCVDAPHEIEERHSLRKPPSSSSSSSSSAPVAAKHVPNAFLQSTLWNHGASVKRRLSDGSTVMVHDGAGLPRSHILGKFLCKSCLQTFSNQGALAVHIRFHHPSDEAALNRLHTRATSSTTTTLNTMKRNTTSTTSTTSLSSELIDVDDDEPIKKKKKTTGAAKRRRYSAAKKWVS